jgi:hypothetical protein
MIMDTQFDDDVSGTVIGRYLLTGVLRYACRDQGPRFRAETDDELRTLAAERLAALRRDYGPAFADIYPDPDGWRLKIYY